MVVVVVVAVAVVLLGVEVFLAGADVVAVARTTAAAAGAAGPVMLVMMLVRQVTEDPPGFPEPLHWLTVIGIAALTLEPAPTVQRAVPPPPLAEPLHWVTVAPLLARAGPQPRTPVPPPAEPTHWLTLGAVSDCAPGVFTVMMFEMVTSQMIGSPGEFRARRPGAGGGISQVRWRNELAAVLSISCTPKMEAL